MTEFRVCPYRFTDRPREAAALFRAIGLVPVVTEDDFAVLRGTAGMVAVHPLGTASQTSVPVTMIELQVDDARATAERFADAGAVWWDEAYGRQATLPAPWGTLSLHEPMVDLYGYRAHDDVLARAVEVTAILFGPDPEPASAFLTGLGFTVVEDAPGWRSLRGAPGAGSVGLHHADAVPNPADAGAISFSVAEPLPELVARLRDLGHSVTEEPDAAAPHVTVTDPDGVRIEIHALR